MHHGHQIIQWLTNFLSFFIHLVPRYIYVETCSFPFANDVKVWVSQIRPEFLMLIAVPWEVEHTGGGGEVYINTYFQKISIPGNGIMSKNIPGIIFKTVLHSLTVMDIPVNYQHPEDATWWKYLAAFGARILLTTRTICTHVTFSAHIFALRIELLWPRYWTRRTRWQHCACCDVQEVCQQRHPYVTVLVIY